MEVYKIIYSYEVFRKIGEGEQVYVLDRQSKSVALINDMSVREAISIMNGDTQRYEFWISEKAEETVDE